MKYRLWSAVCCFEDGNKIKIQLLTNRNDLKIRINGEEIQRLSPGASKSLYIDGATGSITETEYIFDVGGNYIEVIPNGNYRPVIKVFRGLTKFSFGKTEILTSIVLGSLFVGALLLAILI